MKSVLFSLSRETQTNCIWFEQTRDLLGICCHSRYCWWYALAGMGNKNADKLSERQNNSPRSSKVASMVVALVTRRFSIAREKWRRALFVVAKCEHGPVAQIEGTWQRPSPPNLITWCNFVGRWLLVQLRAGRRLPEAEVKSLERRSSSSFD